MDTKDIDKSEESKKNHIRYYRSLEKIILDIKEEKNREKESAILNHLDKRIEAMEEDKKRIREMFPNITKEEWNDNSG
jgi:ERCC4-type nuclease